MASKATNLTPGDRVTALDSAGNLYHGHIDHSNQCGQPFYAFPSALTATGERQPGFAGAVDDCLGIDGIERQKLYVRHMQRNS